MHPQKNERKKRMPKNLVIVESPAKAKTIGKFLGKDYEVLSSYGHIRDLKKKDFSIDIKHDYAPIYEIPEDKKELVKTLKAEAKKADTVWLASDEDREGEAISWHLFEVLGLTPEKTKRIVFHEITKNAILHAIESPRSIDLNLVNAQQARRVLDRIVGFELSPVLWKKIKPSLSAGRVQSVAVRLIVEREKEIKGFEAEEYYRVVATFTTPEGAEVRAELSKRLASQEEAMAFLEAMKDAEFTVSGLAVKPVTKTPAAPFTTSTLQQEASRKLGFSVSQTMMVAQRLYESGHITYMRTDSVNLSSLAMGTISNEIKETLGENYYKHRTYHTTSKGAQEAHEAIRPTFIANRTIEGNPQEKRLYDLIWKRTIATQMADAQFEKTTIEISVNNRDEKFIASGETLIFDGFLKVYMESADDDDATDGESDTNRLPVIKENESLALSECKALQRVTQHPPRYSEAMLVKKLEELGIGRPSTYAPTISTIQNREYVEKGDETGEKRDLAIISLKAGKIKTTTKTETSGAAKGKLKPTDIGVVVNDFLMEYFPDILDYNFTANVEQKFDQIAEGQSKWNDVISTFYALFHPEVEKISNLRLEHKIGERILGTDPKSGKEVSVKIGRFGPIVQIGSTESNEKPQFASLLKGQSIDTITLDEALKLFELPRTVGEYEGADVVVAIGRFGPYVKHDGKFVSIPKTFTPQTITLDECVELIKSKADADKKKLIKKFDEEPELEVLNGPYGAYIAYKKKNYKLPKTVKEPAELTVEECMAIIEEAANAPKKPRRKATAKKK